MEVGDWELEGGSGKFEIGNGRLEMTNNSGITLESTYDHQPRTVCTRLSNPNYPPPTTDTNSPIPYSIIRYWKTQDQDFTTEAQRHRVIENGWMPPHPSLFIRKEIFEKYGLYRTDMKIAADYEMILRLFYKYKITSRYLPLTTYCMTIGGASNKSLRNIITKSREDYRSMKMHSLSFPFKTLVLKNLSKIPQFFLNK